MRAFCITTMEGWTVDDYLTHYSIRFVSSDIEQEFLKLILAVARYVLDICYSLDLTSYNLSELPDDLLERLEEVPE